MHDELNYSPDSHRDSRETIRLQEQIERERAQRLAAECEKARVEEREKIRVERERVEFERLRLSSTRREVVVASASDGNRHAPQSESQQPRLSPAKSVAVKQPYGGDSRQHQSSMALSSPSTPRSGDILDMRIEDLSNDEEEPKLVSAESVAEAAPTKRARSIATNQSDHHNGTATKNNSSSSSSSNNNHAVSSLQSLKDSAITALAAAERSLSAMRQKSEQVRESLEGRRARRQGKKQENRAGQANEEGINDDNSFGCDSSPGNKLSSPSLAFTTRTHSLTRHLQQSINTPFLLEANRRCMDDSVSEAGSPALFPETTSSTVLHSSTNRAAMNLDARRLVAKGTQTSLVQVARDDKQTRTSSGVATQTEISPKSREAKAVELAASRLRRLSLASGLSQEIREEVRAGLAKIECLLKELTSNRKKRVKVGPL